MSTRGHQTLWGCLLSASLACTDGGADANNHAPATTGPIEELVIVEEPAPTPAEVDAPPGPAARTPENCPNMFTPSLLPLEPPALHPQNNARRFQHLRRKLERIEVIDLSTHRILFGVDDQTMVEFRDTPDDDFNAPWRTTPSIQGWAVWDIGLLLHVDGEPLPFLAYVFGDREVYFANAADPWDPTVMYDEQFRPSHSVHSIPRGDALLPFLTDKLGPFDPFEKEKRRRRHQEDTRCGRVSESLGEPFPDIPRATVEGSCYNPDPLAFLFAPHEQGRLRPPITPHNSAILAQRSRARIRAVEVVHALTHHTLFELDEPAIAALRETPASPPLRLHQRLSPDAEASWPIVLLIELDDDEPPFLAHPVGVDELYFPEDDFPWLFGAEFHGQPREMYPIPIDAAVYRALARELGEADPGGRRWAAARRAEDLRCGRAPSTTDE